MSAAELVVILLKIVVMLGFFLTMAAVGIWADRRQSAMVQDRVGPNRAVFYLPSMVARVVVLLPPTFLGAVALLPALPFFPAYHNLQPAYAFQVLTITVQLAVLVGWVSLALLTGSVRRSGALNAFEGWFSEVDPRTIFFAGVALHAVAFALTSAVTLDAVILAARVGSAVLAALLFLTGIYTASRVHDGPVPVRLAGLVHSVADVIKLVMKEDFVPKNADRLMHALAPMIALFPAFVTMAVLPFGSNLCLPGDPGKPLAFSDLGRVAPQMSHQWACQGHTVGLQIADLNVGLLYVFAMGGTGVVGAALAGWASDNKFSLLGGLRAASQMVSYEVAMGLSLVGLFLVFGTVRLNAMVQWQSDNAWGIFVQPFAFFLFLAALIAETKRTPFDAPEGESEIVAGYFLEYSGMKFGMFFMGEYIELFISSALLVTLFFGGYALPFLHHDGITVALGGSVLFEYKIIHGAVVAISALTFFGKVMLMAFVQIFIRWTLPRFRYDQVMKLGWTKLLPLSLANIMVTGVLVLAANEAGPDVAAVLKVAADATQALVALGALALFVALVVGLLEPVERKRFLASTSARFAAAAGGTKATPQQAESMANTATKTPWTRPAHRQVAGKPVARPARTPEVQAYIPELMKGMALTMRHFFKNTKELVLGQKPDPVLEGLEEGITTIHYPEEKRPYPERFRGLHRLTLRDDGSPRCVACLCCSTACPAQCISIKPAEYPVDDPRRGYERFPESFVIDELRCIFCGYCVEACPCDAIRMDTGMHAVPYDSRDQFIYEKDQLLHFTGRSGEKKTENPRHEPGDPTHPGLTRDHESH